MLTNKALIEGIIFASAHPIAPRFIAELLDLPLEEVEASIAEIKSEHEADSRGIFLADVASGLQFRTKADLKEVMAKFYQKKAPKLTQATMEVLSVIAYKQPITRPQIEKIRGVDCTAVLKSLLDRELIEMRGRSDLPGHPVVYGTAEKFLEWFQIKSLADLPPLSEMEILNQGRPDEPSEEFLSMLNKDDGFTAESLSEMDDTLHGIKNVNVEGLLEPASEGVD